MKKLLLIILLLQLSRMQGQSWIYHSFPADSAIWVQQHVSSDGTPYYSRTYFIGDTVIGAYTYHKVYSTSSMYYTAGGYYPGPVPAQPYNAIREDLPAKRVYLLDLYTGVERLLYDFSLHTGDIAVIDSTILPPDTIRVTGIDSVNVGGFYHKQLLLASSVPGMGMMAANWIEGVGSDAGLQEHYTEGFEFSNQLACFSVRNVAEYPAGTSSTYCGFALGIKELEGNVIAVTLGPNPAADEVSLRISCKDTYSVDVMNAKGEVILSKKDLQLSGTRLDISSLAKGIYFVRISDPKGNSATRKIIKQ